MDGDAEEVVAPLLSFPVCMLCQQPLVHITHPILLPCTHYIVCLPCFETETGGFGRVKCRDCAQLCSNSSKDEYIADMICRLSTMPSEALPQEEVEKHQLAVYLRRYQKSHPPDLAQISLLPQESHRSNWDCFYCAEKANDQVRCRKCRRVNLNKVEDVWLPGSIAALLNQTQVIQVSAIGLVFPAIARVDLGRPIHSDSSIPKSQASIPQKESNPAVFEPALIHEESKANSPIDPLSFNEIAKREENEPAEWSQSTDNKSGALIPSGSASLPTSISSLAKSKTPDFIQLPPGHIQVPALRPKPKPPCCLLI